MVYTFICSNNYKFFYHFFKNIIKTKLLEESVESVDCSLRKHVNFVDTTTKQSTHFEKIIVVFVNIVSFFFFPLFKYSNEKHLFFRTNI